MTDFSLDHIVISVSELDAAIASFARAGFTVIKGGTHASGATHNALIVFEDGVYLELIALKDGFDTADSEFNALLRHDEGFTGFALYCDDLQTERDRMIAQGLNIAPIQTGSRLRDDGTQLEWKMCTFEDQSMSPFFIQDITPREWRVPATKMHTSHTNTAWAVASLELTTPDIGSYRHRYKKILDVEPEFDSKKPELGYGFHMDNFDFQALILLEQPGDASTDDVVVTRDIVPTKLTLYSRQPREAIQLHNTQIEFFSYLLD